MKTTLIQSDIIWQNVEANLTNYEKMLQSVESSDLLIFPEMFSIGFGADSMDIMIKFQELSMAWLKQISMQRHAMVVASVPVCEYHKLWNRLLVYYPDGHYDSYDKRHLFEYGGESHHFTAGTQSLIFNCQGFNIKPLICYDLRFPVWSKNQYRNGKYDYDVLIYIANWPASRAAHFKQLLIARAIENQSYCIGVNRVGIDGKGIQYSGDSMIINPEGEVMIEALSDHSTVLIENLTMKELQSYRQKFPFLKSGDSFIINI